MGRRMRSGMKARRAIRLGKMLRLRAMRLPTKKLIWLKIRDPVYLEVRPYHPDTMPKKFFRRITTNTHKFKEHKSLKFFGKLLHNENLWHVNRNSISRAVAIGLFTAFIPVPFQMVIAAALAIFAHANLPLSAALVWITNPITMPPIFFATYKLGARLLDLQPRHWHSDFSLQSLASELTHIWKPLFLGSFLVGICLAVIGYFGIRLIWRLRVGMVWSRRGT